MLRKHKSTCTIGLGYVQQDWVAFMAQPYWVEVKVEVGIEAEDDLSQSVVEIE